MAWVNPQSRAPLEKLIFRQLVTKIQAFYGKQRSNLWVNKRLVYVSILNQINSVHDLQPYLFNIHFNNILPLTQRSSRWSNSFRLCDRKYVSISLLPRTCHMPRSPHSPWFHHPKNVWWGVKNINLITSSIFFDEEIKRINKNTSRKTKYKRREQIPKVHCCAIFCYKHSALLIS